MKAYLFFSHKNAAGRAAFERGALLFVELLSPPYNNTTDGATASISSNKKDCCAAAIWMCAELLATTKKNNCGGGSMADSTQIPNYLYECEYTHPPKTIDRPTFIHNQQAIPNDYYIPRPQQVDINGEEV
jgi:hypothetical protein